MIRELPDQDPYFRGVHSERGEEAQRLEKAAYAYPDEPDRPQPARVETQLAASPKKLKSGT